MNRGKYNRVIEEALRVETGHMTKVEAGIEIVEEHLVKIKDTADLEREINPPLVIKVKRKGGSTVEIKDIL